MTNTLTPAQLEHYRTDGYILLRGLFDAEETALLRRSAKEDKALDDHAFGRGDGEGGKIRLSLWNHPGDGIYGMFARSQRLVGAVADVLGEEPYHYHSKMIMKDARVGGAWAWHQDYGYWYSNGVLAPNLCSAFIAVDPATRENGCLQVIRGSHNLGRIDHVLKGEQAGADLERVTAILERHELVHVLMEPGDTILFHANTLHRSDQNKSEHPRWSMISCYNAKSNDPYRDGPHPRYTPIQVVGDEAIKAAGTKRFSDGAGEVAFFDATKREKIATTLST